MKRELSNAVDLALSTAIHGEKRSVKKSSNRIIRTATSQAFSPQQARLYAQSGRSRDWDEGPDNLMYNLIRCC